MCFAISEFFVFCYFRVFCAFSYSVFVFFCIFGLLLLLCFLVVMPHTQTNVMEGISVRTALCLFCLPPLWWPIPVCVSLMAFLCLLCVCKPARCAIPESLPSFPLSTPGLHSPLTIMSRYIHRHQYTHRHIHTSHQCLPCTCRHTSHTYRFIHSHTHTIACVFCWFRIHTRTQARSTHASRDPHTQSSFLIHNHPPTGRLKYLKKQYASAFRAHDRLGCRDSPLGVLVLVRLCRRGHSL